MCRPSKRLQNGLSPLELSIIVEGKRKIIRFPKYIKVTDFNASKQRVKRNVELNEFMDSVKAKFYAIELEMLQRNMPITINSVMDVYYNGFAETNVTILTLFDRHNADAKAKLERGLIVDATYKK